MASLICISVAVDEKGLSLQCHIKRLGILPWHDIKIRCAYASLFNVPT